MIAIRKGILADNKVFIFAIAVIALFFSLLVIMGATREASLTGFAVLVPEPSFATADAGTPAVPPSSITSREDKVASLARTRALLDNDAPVPSLEQPAVTRRTSMPGELIVKFKGVGTSSDEIGAIGSSFGLLGSDELNIGGTRAAAASGIYRLKFSADADMNSVLAAYLASSAVEWAELNYVLEASYTPNDPDYPSQWGLDMIDADDAWDVTTGDAATIIAVVDSGVYMLHDDLAANIWANSGEIADNDVDDDLNGRVDDIQGWDFVDMDKKPEDDNGHGTHVAGIAAAVQDNAEGISGVCPQCTIMPVRVLDDLGEGNAFDVASGIYYAANNNARIILLSLGTSNNSALLKSAIDYALVRGALIIAAAGNEDSTERVYPAAYDGVIAVAAVDDLGERSSYSNYNNWQSGIWIDVAAPGDDIISTRNGGGYETMSGTSMAAAFAAGEAGLLMSNSPALSGKQIGDIIRSTAFIYGGNQYVGMGVINANNAIYHDWAINASFDHDLHDGAFLSGNVSLNGTASGFGFVSFKIDHGLAGPPDAYAGSTLFLDENYTAVNDEFLIGFDTGQLPNGRHMLFLTATDGSQLTKDQLLVFVNNTGAVNDSSAINESMTLYGNVVAPNGISIVGDNITLDCNNNWIIGNGSGTGINITDRRNVTIRNCNVVSYERGFSIRGGANNTIDASSARDTEMTGIEVSFASNISLTSVDVRDVGAILGIYLNQVTDASVVSPRVSDAFHCIQFYGTINARVSNATITDCESTGIRVGVSALNTTIINSVVDAATSGIYLFDVTNTLVRDTDVIADSVGINLARSVNATVERCTFNGSDFVGLAVWYSNKTLIRDISVDATKIYPGVSVPAGIAVEGSKDTVILNPVIVPNATSEAIYLHGVNTTLRNAVLSVQDGTMPAIWLVGNRTLIENVTLTGWQAGIYAATARNNIITNSTIGRSVAYGIELVSSYDNLIYNNNLSNDYNAYDDGVNFWNTSYSCVGGRPNIIGGPCFGGNHWNDYDLVGLDDGSGSDIHTIAGDMIGDTLLPWQGTDIANGGDYAPLYIQYNDTFPPTVNALQPVDKFNSTATVLNFSWYPIGNDLNVSCNLSIDGTTLFSGVPLLNDSAVTYPYGPFADGLHTWQALCIDASGNANASALRTFVVDNFGPRIDDITEEPPSPVTYDENRWYNFSASATDALNAIDQVSLLFDNQSHMCNYGAVAGTPADVYGLTMWPNLTMADRFGTLSDGTMGLFAMGSYDDSVGPNLGSGTTIQTLAFVKKDGFSYDDPLFTFVTANGMFDDASDRYLFLRDSDPFYIYNLTMTPLLFDNSSSAAASADLNGITFPMLGSTATIVNATIWAGMLTKLFITLDGSLYELEDLAHVKKDHMVIHESSSSLSQEPNGALMQLEGFSFEYEPPDRAYLKEDTWGVDGIYLDPIFNKFQYHYVSERTYSWDTIQMSASGTTASFAFANSDHLYMILQWQLNTTNGARPDNLLSGWTSQCQFPLCKHQRLLLTDLSGTARSLIVSGVDNVGNVINLTDETYDTDYNDVPFIYDGSPQSLTIAGDVYTVAINSATNRMTAIDTMHADPVLYGGATMRVMPGQSGPINCSRPSVTIIEPGVSLLGGTTNDVNWTMEATIDEVSNSFNMTEPVLARKNGVWISDILQESDTNDYIEVISDEYGALSQYNQNTGDNLLYIPDRQRLAYVYVEEPGITWTLDTDGVPVVPIMGGGMGYVCRLPPLSAGTHNYSFIANDTLGNMNTTLTRQYVVNKALPVVGFNAFPEPPVTYNDSLHYDCFVFQGDNGTSLELSINDSLVASGIDDINYDVKLGAGTYSVNCTMRATQNYTQASRMDILTVNKATPIVDVGVAPESPVVYGTTLASNCTTVFGDPAATLQIYWNGTLFASGTSVLTQSSLHRAGVHDVECDYVASANFSAGSDNMPYTILRANSTVNLTVNGWQANRTFDYGTWTNVTGNLTVGEHFLSLSADRVIINNASWRVSNITHFNTGKHRVEAFYGGNENYTSSNVSLVVTLLPQPAGSSRSSSGSADETCNTSYVCGEWGACNVNSTQTRTCTDVGNCRLQPRTERQSCSFNACANGIADAGEADVDCGGSCGLCADGKRCFSPGDCATGYCNAGTCSVPPQPQQPAVVSNCANGMQDNDELGVDCGGSCVPCAPVATCSDGIQNQGEGGVDCGGPCIACPPEPSCGDSVQNQAETGVDCGGPCAPCPQPKSSWPAIIPAVLLFLAVGAFAAVAVAKKHTTAAPRASRVGTLLDTADGLLLEGRDDEAVRWFDQACKIYEQLAPDQKAIVEEKMTRVRHEIEGKSAENASRSSPKTPESEA